MSQQTLTALSQRDEAFWVGLVLLVLGGPLAAFGALIITTRVAVAVVRILRTTVAAGRFGYGEGLTDDADSDTDPDSESLTE